jgi:hypothetical protein
MTEHPSASIVLTDDAKRFLKRTGVFVIVLEAVVLGAIWMFQYWFGR